MLSIIFLLFALPLFAMPSSFPETQKIAFQNTILCKVNGKTFSMMDVKKRLDLLFHESYPQWAESSQARYQFYEASWRHVLSEMIDHELILDDAANREIKLSDGEVRERLEDRFGPNVSLTLDQIGLTYDEAWKMVKNELIVQRMSWWFIHARALQRITPQEIRQAYQAYLKENPSYREWTYRVLSIRGENLETQAEAIYCFLLEKGQAPELLIDSLKENFPSLQLSALFIAKDQELSEDHKEALLSLSAGEYSRPKTQTSRRDNKGVVRIFFLQNSTDHPAPSFEELAPKLQSELTQQAVAQESEGYLNKLRKNAGFDAAHLEKTLPPDMHPFSISPE